MFRIAIIGRPNVGKSTLFNKLVGKSFAITDDTPGVTRDRREAHAKLGPLEFMAIDTAGLEKQISSSSLQQRMVEQTAMAVDDADLCLFVVDGKNGIEQDDIHFANWLRKLEKKAILIANKCENFDESMNFGSDFFRLGFGSPLAISAEHKLGFGELYDKIAPEMAEYEKLFENLMDKVPEGEDVFLEDYESFKAAKTTAKNSKILAKKLAKLEAEEESRLQIAVIGRPNAGKSTFLNQILGKERFITGPEAGITRDAVSADYEILGQKIRFVDTAGIRKKSNINAKLEKLSTIDSFRAIRFAQVVILLIDANSLLDHQDMALAGQVLREGRALIFGINKIDEVSIDREVFMKQVRTQIQELLPEISGAPILPVSAKSGYNVAKILDYALKTYSQWQTYINTSKLNEWLRFCEKEHAPKLHKGRPIRLKFATQIKRRPPTFAVFTNHPTSLEGSYQRYLINSLRDYFDLGLTPIRLTFKKSENPYAEKKEKTFSKKIHQKKSYK